MSSGNTILITGSSGFIGGHLVNEALNRGLRVCAGVRASSNRKYLTDARICFSEFDLSSSGQTTTALKNLAALHGNIDYIIHNAGLTKALDEKEYFNSNAYNTKKLIDAINDSGIKPKKFVLISSLAAYGPGNPVTFLPVTNEHRPAPITSYGKSKLMAEQVVIQQQTLPWVIIRPTAVYGPGEKEIFALFNLINKRIHPVLLNRNQQLSFIYVKDLARATVDATLSPHANKSYFVSDGHGYSSKAMGRFIKAYLKQSTLDIPLPSALLNVIAHTLERFYSVSKKTPALNVAKAKEMNSLNWLCDINPLTRDTGFIPQYNLESGIKETIDWYKKEKWLK